MRLSLRLLLLCTVLFLAACSSSRKAQKEVMLDEVEIRPDNRTYRAAATRVNDLLHTKLEVNFDFEKQYLFGKATLKLKPYFYPTSTLTLDAKGFDLNMVAMITADSLIPLNYTYDTLQIKIDLGKTFTREDTFDIIIDYVAKPNELEEGGSSAITSDKGLYFINPVGIEKNKPFQVWTQGETEASSCWFPTIDKPNERTTQEIFITVPDSLMTLSNGKLITSIKNKNGTRTDFWKQTLDHTPYLFMMAIGQFSVIKDRWRDIPVDYYVEPYYEPYAKDIFGDTPEMMELYSKQLGYDYPWDKYAQIPVRDYVSGAMENTSASIFFDGVQMTRREMIDGKFESIVAHELYHQWFGDLVTCESWSNLPLNESFATYGEYLWFEHKYGRYKADRQLEGWLNNVLRQSAAGPKTLIRFHYQNKEDMFDVHSYDKGGLILHMLRNYVGDEAFFAGLNKYLTDNEFQAVEIHQLRLAFEAITGEDLNWFFNQWFLQAGIPELEINYDFIDSSGTFQVKITQKQDQAKNPVYKLPIAIDLYSDEEVRREEVTIDEGYEVFEFKTGKRPLLANVDADKVLVASIKDNKTTEEWIYQFNNAPLYRDKKESLTYLGSVQNKDSLALKVLVEAISHEEWPIRRLAIQKVSTDAPQTAKQSVNEMALTDEKAYVRRAALEKLGLLKDQKFKDTFIKSLQDSSFAVIAASLEGLKELDEDTALALAHQFNAFNTYFVVRAVGELYASTGYEGGQDYFEEMAFNTTGWTRSRVIDNYGEYLAKENEKSLRKGVETLEGIALTAGSMWDRWSATSAIHSLKKSVDNDENIKLEEMDKEALSEELKDIVADIVAQEKNENLKKRYEKFEQ